MTGRILGWSLFWLLAVMAFGHSQRDSEPLQIDATPTGGAWCDVPKHRAPIPRKRLNPMVGGLDKPNGEIA